MCTFHPGLCLCALLFGMLSGFLSVCLCKATVLYVSKLSLSVSLHVRLCLLGFVYLWSLSLSLSLCAYIDFYSQGQWDFKGEQCHPEEVGRRMTPQ